MSADNAGHPQASGADADNHQAPGRISIAPGVLISEGLLRWAFSRSSGPGGQNVNKLSTKAELRIAIDDLPINGRARGRLRRLANTRIVGEQTVLDEEGRPRAVGGELVLTSQSERSQSANKSECLDKLRELLVQALHEPKVRRKTKPTRGSKERRLTAKKHRGDIKRNRGGGHD